MNCHGDWGRWAYLNPIPCLSFLNLDLRCCTHFCDGRGFVDVVDAPS